MHSFSSIGDAPDTSVHSRRTKASTIMQLRGGWVFGKYVHYTVTERTSTTQQHSRAPDTSVHSRRTKASTTMKFRGGWVPGKRCASCSPDARQCCTASCSRMCRKRSVSSSPCTTAQQVSLGCLTPRVSRWLVDAAAGHPNDAAAGHPMHYKPTDCKQAGMVQRVLLMLPAAVATAMAPSSCLPRAELVISQQHGKLRPQRTRAAP